MRDQGFLLENGLENGFDSMTETGFVLLEGPVRIFDYENFSNTAENFDRLDEFFNSNLSQNQLKKKRESPEHRRFVRSKVLIDTFFTASTINIDPVVSGKHVGTWQLTGADSQHLYEKTVDACLAYRFNNYEYRCKDAIRVRLTDSEGQGFIGPLSREHLRENMRNLIFKHGSEPKDDWVMLAEITRLPLRGGSPGARLQELLGGGQSGQGQQSNLSEMINSVVDVFDTFQELIGSASRLDVAVSPIAVYREVHPRM